MYQIIHGQYLCETEREKEISRQRRELAGVLVLVIIEHRTSAERRQGVESRPRGQPFTLTTTICFYLH